MTTGDFTKVIRKLGKNFQTIKEDDDSHNAYEVWFAGKYITRVKNSHSPKDWQDQLIANNLHIGKSKLREFVACTFSNEQLIEKMKEKNKWPRGTI